MKLTLSQSKILIQKLQLAKNKFINAKYSLDSQNGRSYQIENQQAFKQTNSIGLIIEKAKKHKKDGSVKKIDFIR